LASNAGGQPETGRGPSAVEAGGDQKKLDGRQDEIVKGQLIVFAQDECHLLWGDTRGYVWGQRGERTEIPIRNIKEKQTYYGALNLLDRDFVLMPSENGDGKNTVSFIKRLQGLNPEKKLLIIWDGARYHDCGEVRTYLDEVNRGLEERDWKITFLLFAPNAPDQNPVEDVWLRAKNHLRKHFYENKTFQQVKSCFFNFISKQIFNFSKIDWYLTIPQSV
jgi:putative transposase